MLCGFDKNRKFDKISHMTDYNQGFTGAAGIGFRYPDYGQVGRAIMLPVCSRDG